jgi:hypothetical protein
MRRIVVIRAVEKFKNREITLYDHEGSNSFIKGMV